MKDDIFTGLVFASNLKKSDNLLMAILMLSNGKISPHQAMLYSALPEDEAIEKRNMRSKKKEAEQPKALVLTSESDKQLPLNAQEKIPLLNNSFFTRTPILLASNNGLEKGLVGIEAVKRGLKNGSFEKVCFLNLGHLDDGFRPYYEKAFPDGKYKLFFKTDWNRYFTDA
ncbi:hypothetical protein FACS1894172_03300 [Spirochaetia bacterium]|nr:hypothetical protein FACS1894172_03300 [Spirochaetia bacterium]